MSNQEITNDIKLFADALLSGASPKALQAEFGLTPDEDLPIDPTDADLESICGSRILPTIGICKYLASDDELTDEIIDSMELSLERYYHIKAPFFITSFRDSKNGKLSLSYFYIACE